MTKWTPAAEKAVKEAGRIAAALGRTLAGSEHILLGFFSTDNSIAAKLLADRRIGFSSVLKLMRYAEPVLKTDKTAEGVTPQLRKILDRARTEAVRCGSFLTGTEHILLSVVSESECAASRLITAHGVRLSEIYTDVMSVAGVRGAVGDKRKKRDTPYLQLYGTDLCELALSGRLGPVIGRKEETERIIRILCRKTKNNPCLIGEAGVGKTAIVEGIAQMIAENRAPRQLCGKTVVSVDISSMLSGSKYRGEFEERIKGVITEACADPDVILFIDEVHTIVGAGAAEGAVDAANILKPALGRAEIRLIGATTYAEYKKSIGADAALCRRFQPVGVAEPTETDTLEILKGVRPVFEAHHRVNITNEALSEAVRLSCLYIKDRYLPDKAIDVLDEACASFIVRGSEEHAPELLFSGTREKAEKRTVGADLIKSVVMKAVGAPPDNCYDHGAGSLKARLEKRIFGQDEAISRIAETVGRMRSGLCGGKRPYASMLFYGPSGVGKTETCRALAYELFGGENAFIRLDMSEYTERHTVSRLIGSPPGYIGYGESGILTDVIRKRPFSVVCFDNAEKAHPDIISLITQILSEGELTDPHGIKADFSGSVIVLTAGASGKSRALGFGGGETVGFDFLPQSLTGCLDAAVEFKPLGVTALASIAAVYLNEITEKAKRSGVDLMIGEGVTKTIADNCRKDGGARGIKAAVDKIIAAPLSELILGGKTKKAAVTVSGGKICVGADKTY